MPLVNGAIGSKGANPAQVQQALDESGLSVTGAGVKVGVLSDSFNNLGGAAADEADGALPPAADIQVLADLASGILLFIAVHARPKKLRKYAAKIDISLQRRP